MQEIPMVAADASVDVIAAHLRLEGCVVVERLACGELISQIDAELAPVLADTTTNNTEFAGQQTKRLNGLLSAVPTSQRLALHPLILDVVERMLTPYCAKFQLNYDGFMHLLPGESNQPLHRDGMLYPFRHPAPPYLIACMWAQSDFTPENGGTRLIPGSHLWDHDQRANEDEVMCTDMAQGSVLIYTGGVFHGAGANVSRAPRTGISMQYNLAWLRQELNMYLTYPPEVARYFPDKLQRLIGYELAAPYLGFINAGSPHLALEVNSRPATRERTTPELDAAIERIEPIRFG